MQYWKIKEKGSKIHFYCPALDSEYRKSFKMLRVMYKELKYLESVMSKKYSTAVMYTETKNLNVIKIIIKLGYEPYYTNLEFFTIWFKKSLRS
jgi:hypothetical protein